MPETSTDHQQDSSLSGTIVARFVTETQAEEIRDAQFRKLNSVPGLMFTQTLTRVHFKDQPQWIWLPQDDDPTDYPPKSVGSKSENPLGLTPTQLVLLLQDDMDSLAGNFGQTERQLEELKQLRKGDPKV